MKITLLVVGKTNNEYIKQGTGLYLKRLKHYIHFEIIVIQDIKKNKKSTAEYVKEKEGELILMKDAPGKEIHLFDEKGKMFTSREFAAFLNQKMISGIKELVFVIGGAYGFSESVYKRANSKISLSKMTFSHQMVRILCVEQMYRAFTILKGEPYHHD